MSPPHRRRRRTSGKGAAVLVAAVVVAVVLALLIGGVASEGKGSASYWRQVDTSYVAEMRPLIQESDALGSQVRTELAAIVTQTRPQAQAALDTLTRRCQALATRAATLDTPSPPGGIGPAVTGILAARATAVTTVRTTVDRLLQMAPLAVAGPVGTATTQLPADPAPISPSAAMRALSGVQAGLSHQDGRYAADRRALRGDWGRATLPGSSWESPHPIFGTDGASGLVTRLESSSTLAAVHDVELLDKALGVTPAPVPPPPGSPSGMSVVPPTRSLSLTVVVTDSGNVGGRRIPVSARVAPLDGGTGSAKSATVSVAPGGSVSVVLAPLRVRPGTSYSVTVSLRPPAGEVPGAATSDTFEVKVAPPTPTPPSTTTTTAPRPTTTTTTTPGATTTTAPPATTTSH
jgi:hypothetical protein